VLRRPNEAGLQYRIVLTRFDDHLSFYRLEQQFRERHVLVIPRQQMVQCIMWLQALYDAMWQRMLDGRYLQVDKTSVPVFDPGGSGEGSARLSLVLCRSRWRCCLGLRRQQESGWSPGTPGRVYRHNPGRCL
jgi:Transposase IS66 family